MEILRVENVCRTYDTGGTAVNALTDISFSVQKGEFIAIVGASGSGKSTLLHILGGIDRPTSGEVFVNGQSVYERTEDQLAVFRRRQVGLIYQFYNLIPVLTVEENITLPVRLDGRKINKKRLAGLLQALGLTKYRKHLPGQLSGGQQQRAAIGRALMNAPAILLADEPTGSLDTQNTQEILQLLKASNKTYRQTIILITHYMEEVIYADTVLVMDGGEVVMQGTPREIFSQVERLKELRLDVPQVTLLAYELKKSGLPLPDGILTADELAAELKKVGPTR